MQVFEAFRRGENGYREGLALTEAEARAMIAEFPDVHDVRVIDVPVVFLVVHDPDGYDRHVSTAAVYSTHDAAMAATLHPTDAIELVELK